LFEPPLAESLDRVGRNELAAGAGSNPSVIPHATRSKE
jgi:hypothetical protein